MKTELQDFTVLDFETSGLDGQHDQIIEACVIRVRQGEPVLVFNTLVHFEGELNPKITELTGHTIEDLKGGISEYQLANALRAMIAPEELLIAYNAPFDLEFLERLLGKHLHDCVMGNDRYTLPNPFIDPLTAARDRSPYPHKLVDSCKRYGVTLDDAHSAYADTFALLDLVEAMNKEKPLYEYLNVIGYREKYGKPTWQPQHATLKVQGKAVYNQPSNRQPLKPKSDGVVVTTNNAKKRRPAPVVDDTTLPTGLVLGDEELGRRVEEFERRMTQHLFIKHNELGKVLDYLALRKYPANAYRYYNGEEVGITIVQWEDNTARYSRMDDDPFAPGFGPIEISEDDLPF